MHILPETIPPRAFVLPVLFVMLAAGLLAPVPYTCTPALAQQDVAVSCERIAEECPDAVIDEVRIEDHDIFEASDNIPSWLPWKLANRLHINTREATIRTNLLFKRGDRLDVERIRETQRKLRSLNYFRDEKLSCTQTAPGRVRVDVHLKENWSIIPILDFQGQGLGTAVTVGLSQQNLLGRGKVLSGTFRNGAREGNTIIEQRWTVAYLDPNILGSQYRMYGTYQGLETGETAAGFVEKPFFSLEALWSGKIYANHSRRRQYLYQGGGIAAQFNQLSGSYGVDFGLALKRGPPTVHRVRAFYTYELKRISDFVPFPGATPVVAPPDETYSYPGLGYRRLGVDYIKETRIDRFDREEFFNLANDFDIWLGYSVRALGAENDELIFSVSDRQGYRFREGHFFFLQGSANGFLNGSDLYNTKLGLSYNHYLRDTCLDFWWIQNTFHWGASIGYGIDLDSDQVFGLGYSTGLRGYDYYEFTGSNFLRFGVEDRIFSKEKILNLVALGVLLFAESGFAWGPEEDMDLDDLRYDVGFGLRFAFPAATAGNVLRLDWGFPIGHGKDFFGDMVFTISVSSFFG